MQLLVPRIPLLHGTKVFLDSAREQLVNFEVVHQHARNLVAADRLEYVLSLRLPHVNEHVRVRRILVLDFNQLCLTVGELRMASLVVVSDDLKLMHFATDALSERMMLGDFAHIFVIELEPAVVHSWPDEGVVMAAIHVATVHQDRVQVVLVDDIVFNAALAERPDVLLAAKH